METKQPFASPPSSMEKPVGYSTEHFRKRKLMLLTVASIGFLILLLALVMGYFWRKNPSTLPLSNEQREVVEESTKGTLPSLSTNPLENQPNINPVENSNPIKEIKINPFE